MKRKRSSSGRRRFGKILLIFAVVWILMLVALQFVLSPSFLTGIAGRYAAEYIDGNVSFGSVDVSVFRSFPNLNVTFKDASITYSSEKFGKIEKAAGAGGGFDRMLLSMGAGPGVDTLAYFSEFSASVNIVALAFKKIRIPSLQLSSPRIFAHDYSSGARNWDVFRSSDIQDSSGYSFALPSVSIEKIVLSDNPFIVYCNPADSIFASVRLKKALFKGKVTTDALKKARVNLEVDSFSVAGRMAGDTLAFGFETMNIKEHSSHFDVKADARVFLAMQKVGRMALPVHVDSHISFPKDTVPAISVKNLKISVASIEMSADADMRYLTDSIYLKGSAVIPDCRIDNALRDFAKNFWQDSGKLKTDAVLSLNASFDGYLNLKERRFPAVSARLLIPESEIAHAKYRKTGKIGLDVVIENDYENSVNVGINEFALEAGGLAINLKADVSDLFGEDPLLDFSGKIRAELDTLAASMKQADGIFAEGSLNGEFKGQLNKSQLDSYRFTQADMGGFLRSGRLRLVSEKDSISVYADSLNLILASVGNKFDTNIEEGTRMLAVVAEADSLRLKYKDALSVSGKNVSFKAQNSAEILNSEDSSLFLPFGGRFTADRLAVMDADSSIIGLSGTENIFTIYPKKDAPDVPVLNLSSHSGFIFLRGPVSRIGVRAFDVDATASMTSVERRRKVKAFVDSLSAANPDVPKDSLFIFMKRNMPERKVPEWLSEKDFRKKDLDFKLDSSLVSYLRDWDANMTYSAGSAFVATPYFPLRTVVRGMKGSVSNNEIKLDSFTLKSGTSEMSMQGRITGLRRALLNNGILKVKVDVVSDSLNINELFNAYALGSKFNRDTVSTDVAALDDSEYQDMVAVDTLADAALEKSSLIVLPANIDAEISLNASDVSYSLLHMDKVTSDIVLRQRCLRITNTVADSNVGDMSFEGFYSTRTKKDLKTGFNMSFNNITAEKIVELLPAVDSILPMLKSFKGNLDCELAATAMLDTSMNIVMPSVSGIFRIGGTNLVVEESETFKRIAKTLKFKDKHNGRIDKMSVEGVIGQSRLEIFPFILKIDRYTLAMSGIQNLDTSFKYHISVLQSPLVFRLGIDLYGDFNDVKFKIGKAKYKSTDVPVFSEVIDQAKINLHESIENIFIKGVDRAVRENEQQRQIERRKEELNYVQAVDQKLDSLSIEEEKLLNGNEIGEQISQQP